MRRRYSSTLSTRRCATNRTTRAVACRPILRQRIEIETGCSQRFIAASILLLRSSSDLILNCLPIPNESNRLLLNCFEFSHHLNVSNRPSNLKIIKSLKSFVVRRNKVDRGGGETIVISVGSGSIWNRTNLCIRRHPACNN